MTCSLFQSIIGVGTAFSPNFYVFMILRFFVGALEQVREYWLVNQGIANDFDAEWGGVTKA